MSAAARHRLDEESQREPTHIAELVSVVVLWTVPPAMNTIASDGFPMPLRRQAARKEGMSTIRKRIRGKVTHAKLNEAAREAAERGRRRMRLPRAKRSWAPFVISSDARGHMKDGSKASE